MTEKETNQLNKILAFLHSISERMIQDLNNIINNEDFGLIKPHLKNEIKNLDFEINADGYSINLYAMDSENSQLGYKKILSDYPNGIIADNNLDIDVDDYDFNNSSDMERMDNFYLKLESEFINWFVTCWDKITINNTKYKFYISYHDSYQSFDLLNETWIENEEK
ncbi:hypothetical protein MBM09_07580 [Flaviramulus sp. BrNp1-15]|uniref:hypothetical protein n=1 Tax=Flaviramulus sp. BrNp1-15 TaxID=2916754 RepID=UPI001EE8F2AD|nr:hypothetical protein [Flaviramulus sp. BrNp1-15]ULC60851.1 hypothetical protein MBM09_07580 [Flaviramulus sp. BrNp1-15]